MTKTVASDTLDLADLDRRLEKAQRRYRRRSEKVGLARRSLLRGLEKLNKRECRIAELEALRADSRREHIGEHAASDGPLQDALLIFNPTSGRDREDNALRLAKVVSALRVHGVRARVEVKTSGKAVRAQAAEFVKSGGDLLVVAAGDGTIGDVAAELIGSDTVLGIIPIGTMNNLARSLGIPLLPSPNFRPIPASSAPTTMLAGAQFITG